MRLPIEPVKNTAIKKEAASVSAVHKIDKATAVAEHKEQSKHSNKNAEKVIIATKDESLRLLFNTSIDKINEQLLADFGDNAIQKKQDTQLTNSPEATANQIVTLSTLMFQRYRENYQSEDDNEVLKLYLERVLMGIDHGFEEARIILKGLDALGTDTKIKIENTYQLILEKLSLFKKMVEESIQKNS